MSHLHPTRYGELAPEFELAELFGRALEITETAPLRTDGLGRAHHFAHHGLQALHPATRSPEAREEMRQRIEGTYSGPVGGAAPSGPTELQRLNAEVAKLEARKAERAAQARIDALKAELDDTPDDET